MRIVLILLLLAIGLLVAWEKREGLRAWIARTNGAIGFYLLHHSDVGDASSGRQEPQATDVPEGLYYTRERITIPAGAGTRVVEAATSLRKVGEGNGRYIMEDSAGRFLVDSVQLTREPREVAYLLQKRSVGSAPDPHAALRRFDLEAQIKQIDGQLSVLKTELEHAIARESARATKGAPSNAAMGVGSVFLRNEIARLEQSKLQIQVQQQVSPQKPLDGHSPIPPTPQLNSPPRPASPPSQ